MRRLAVHTRQCGELAITGMMGGRGGRIPGLRGAFMSVSIVYCYRWPVGRLIQKCAMAGAVVGVIGFLALCLLLVCFLRQKRRKAWYSSVAQYYRQQKAVGGSGVVMNHGPVGGFGEEPPMVVDEDPQHQTLHAAYQPSYNSYAPSESTATSYHPLTSNGNSPYSAPFRIPDGPPGPYQPQR